MSYLSIGMATALFAAVSCTPRERAAVGGAPARALGAHLHGPSALAFEIPADAIGTFYSAETVARPLEVCVERQGVVRCVEELACDDARSTPPALAAQGFQRCAARAP